MARRSPTAAPASRKSRSAASSSPPPADTPPLPLLDRDTPASPPTADPAPADAPPRSAIPLAPAALDPGCKDELNLAEFPIAALTDRVPHGQLQLVFEDILEQRDAPPIVRRLTVLGTHKYGLPTAVDDEVMVGLIQLTKRRNNFTDPRVPFSRYELIELLGWPQSGHSYQRIEEALHRWVGVVLSYENAWWDNVEKSWVDENFHILDNVTLYDRERKRPAAARPAAGKKARKPAADAETATETPQPLSSFRWNEVIFRSFQSGNLKQLDLDFYLALRLPTTKRMFRFLDKRFYRRDRIDFDLKTFACEHVGLSRSYKPTELKRRLKPAFDELEEKGFLEPLSPEERYSLQRKGQWRVLFLRGLSGRADTAAEPAAEAAALVESLTDRGVGARAAAELVAAHPSGRVRAKLEVFDWLVQNQDSRVARNAAGYLVSSIRADYQPPDDFEKKAAATRAAAARTAAAEADRRRKAEAKAEAAATEAKDAETRARWDALPDSTRDAITARVKAENPHLRGLRRGKALLEPLCLAELARLEGAGDPLPTTAQPSLFPEG